MEHFTNYQQMVAPARVWESIESNDAVTEFTAAHAVGNIDCSFIFYHLIKVLVDLRLSDRI